MNFRYFIKKPVLSSVINIVIILVGIISLNKLSIREYPKFENNIIEIKTQYSGATAQIVENQVTNIIEEAISGINNVDYVSSISNYGESTVRIHLKTDVKLNDIMIDVMEKVSKITHKLPRQLRPPTISKASNSENNLMYILGTSNVLNNAEIDEAFKVFYKSKIEAVNGVAKVLSSANVTDGGAYAIHGIIDNIKLEKYNITIKEIKDVISRASSNAPLGEIIKNDIAFSLKFNERFNGIEDYKKLVVRSDENGVLYLGDIINFEKNTGEDVSIAKINQKQVVSWSIIMQSGANPIEISENIRKIIENNKKSTNSIEINYFLDVSINIQKSINSVYKTIAEAILFVLLILLLFLGSFRLSLIPLLSIPVSLLGGIIAIYLIGGTINILTLLAMVLAIGLVVDDAMVLIENIHRYLQLGETKMNACILGLQEIQFAIISMTFTLFAVYIPIMFLSGIIGKLFLEFAIVLSTTVLFSGIFTLISVPLLYYHLMQEGQEYKWYKNVLLLLEYIKVKYEKMLIYVFGFQNTILTIAGFLVFYSILLYMELPKTLAPVLDQGIVQINCIGPTGMQMEFIEKHINLIETELSKNHNIEQYYTSLSTNGHNIIFVQLKNGINAKKEIEQIKKQVGKVQGGLSLSFNIFSNNIFSTSENTNCLSLSLLSNHSYDHMEETIKILNQKLRNHPACDSATILSSRIGKEKAYTIKIDEEKALRYGVDISEIIDTLSVISTGQPPVNKFNNNNKQCYFKLIADKKAKNNLDYLKQVKLRKTKSQNNKYELISLYDFLIVEEVLERKVLVKEDGLTQYNVQVQIKNGYSIAEVYKEILKLMEKELKSGYKIEPSGQLKKQLNEDQGIFWLFILAILFIFLILAAQFESFVDPLIILFTIPLSFSGSIIIYFLKNNAEINIFAYIGLITLIGLIVKHGIMIVEFANELLNKEALIDMEALQKTIIQSCVLRLRPILITTLAMFLGALPLVVSSGIGSEIHHAIGWIISGGIMLGTVFTLFVLPIVYIKIKKYSYKIQ